MIKNDNTSISSVYDKTTCIGKIMKGVLKVYESWRKLLSSGIPPLTLLNSAGKDLLDYKIYGNSIQNGTPTLEAPVEIESVGDKTKNLINVTVKLPYISNGLTVSRNSDGSINVKGTPTSAISLYLARNVNFTLPAGTYTLNDTGVNGAHVYLLPKYHWKTFSIGSDTTYTGVYIDISQALVGQSLDFNFYPQLEEGRSFTGYEPYGYKIPIKVSGKNLLDRFKYPETTTVNGITFTNNGDGTFTLNGTATDRADLRLVSNVAVGDGLTAYISGAPSGSSSSTYELVTAYWGVTGEAGRTFQSNTGAISLRVYPGVTVNNLVFKPQIEIGDKKTEFEPYQEPTTTNIYLNEPLRKMGDYADYIDFKNKKAFRNVSELILNGTEGWSRGGTAPENGRVFLSTIDDMSVKPTIISNQYVTVANSKSYSTMGLNEIKGHSTINYLYICADYETVDEFIAYLSEKYNNGTPVKVYYNLKEENPVDIDLPNIPTIKGTTILEIDTNVQPSNIEVIYKGKP